MSSGKQCLIHLLCWTDKKAKAESRSPLKSCCMDRQLELALRDFVTFKTVSSDTSLREDCYHGAKYLCKLLVEVLGEHNTQAL